MIILGIDPGTAIVGWGVIDYRGSDCCALDFGVIRTDSKDPDWQRLSEIYDGIAKIIKKYQPDKVAVESLFYFKNQKTVMTVAQARGVILLAIEKNKIPISEFTPLQIKQALSGYGRADKQQLQKMVKLLCRLKEIPRPDDAADALACAICCGQTKQYDFKK